MSSKDIQPAKKPRSSYQQGEGRGVSDNHSYGPMSVPTTPRKRGHEINQFVADLNKKWDLDIPLQTSLRTPSKLPRLSEGGQIYKHIQFLSFQNPESLDRAIEEFSKHAPYVYSDWVYNPRGEPDTLSSCTGRHSVPETEHAKRRAGLTSTDKSRLQTLLFDLLRTAQGNVIGPFFLHVV